MPRILKKEIYINGINIPYTLKVHSRSKRMRLTLLYDGTLVVTIPLRATIKGAERFLREKRAWLQKYINIDHMRSQKEWQIADSTEYKACKEEVLQLVEQKVAFFNTRYCFSYNRVYVKNHTAQWGSCTEKKNLNFNYRLIHLPEDLQNYLIVHELCHLQEFNHSQGFWRLISLTFPNYTGLKRRLRDTPISPKSMVSNTLVRINN